MGVVTWIMSRMDLRLLAGLMAILIAGSPFGQSKLYLIETSDDQQQPQRASNSLTNGHGHENRPPADRKNVFRQRGGSFPVAEDYALTTSTVENGTPAFEERKSDKPANISK